MKEASSNKQIKIGTILSYITIFLEIGISLIFTPWMIKVIGVSDYAVYTISYSFISIFMFDFGISITSSKFLSEYRLKNETKKANDFVSEITKIYLIIDLVIVTILVCFFFFIDKIYVGLSPDSISKLKISYVIVSLFSVLSFPFLNLDGLLNAHEKFTFLKLATLLNKLITVGLMVCYLFLESNVVGLILINAIVGVVLLIVKLIFCYRKCNLRIRFKRSNKYLVKTIISFSIWIAIISLRDKIINGLMPTILGSVANDAEVSFYGYSMTIITYAYTISSVLSSMFVYRITEISNSECYQEKLNSLFLKIGKIQYLIISFVFFLFVSYGKNFLELFIGPEFSGSYFVAILMLFPFLFSVPKQIAQMTSYIRNESKTLALINISCAYCCIVFSMKMSLYFGALGAAITYCVFCTIIELLSDLLVYRDRLKLNLKKFYFSTYVKTLVPNLILVAISFAIKRFIYPSNKLVFVILCLAFTVLFFAFSFITLFSKEEKWYFLSKIKKKNLKKFPKQFGNSPINIVWITQKFDQSVSPVCDSLSKQDNVNLKVVLLSSHTDYQSYRVNYERDYVFDSEKFDKKTIDSIIINADVAIIGQGEISCVADLNKECIIFKTSEALYKNSRWFYWPLDYYRFRKHYLKYKDREIFYLPIGCNAYKDIIRFSPMLFKRSYTWGYFPISNSFKSEINKEKHGENISILWAGKLTKLKHPEIIIDAVKFYKSINVDCTAKIIGDGEEREKLINLVKRDYLEREIQIIPPVTHSELQEYMSNSSVYIFSSDSREGWGMVLIEAMANSCCCICDKRAGASSIVIKNNINGLLYSNKKELREALESCVFKSRRTDIGNAAKESIFSMWTCDVAAERFVNSLRKGAFGIYQEGPTSLCQEEEK